MALARNQVIVLSILANDLDKLTQVPGHDYIGRTSESIVIDASKWIGRSSIYAALDAVIKQKYVSERYKTGRLLNGRVGRPVHLVSITDTGYEAFKEEHERMTTLKT